MPATRTSGARKAMIRATASSDAVSVSIKNVLGTRDSIADRIYKADLWLTSKKCRVTRFPGDLMYTPATFTVALLMMISSAICWGSWANTYKGVKNYRFELFYWDYAVGIFLVSLVLAFTMGSTGHDSSSFLANVQTADGKNILSTLVGGAIF